MKTLLSLGLVASSVMMLGGCFGGAAGGDAGKALKTSTDKASTTFKDATTDLVHDQRMVYARNIGKLFELSAQGQLDDTNEKDTFVQNTISKAVKKAVDEKRPEAAKYAMSSDAKQTVELLWDQRKSRASITQQDNDALRKAFAEFACQGIGLHEEQHAAFATLSQFNRTVAQLTGPSPEEFSELLASLRENSGQIKGLTVRKRGEAQGKNFAECVNKATEALSSIDTADFEAAVQQVVKKDQPVTHSIVGGVLAFGGVIEAGELLVKGLKAAAKYALQEADKAKRQARFEQFLANGSWAGENPKDRQGKVISAEVLTKLACSQMDDAERAALKQCMASEGAEKAFTSTEIAIYQSLGPCALVGKLASGNAKAVSDEMFDPVQEAYFSACMTGEAENKQNRDAWNKALLEGCPKEPNKDDKEDVKKTYQECRAKLEKSKPALAKSVALIADKKLDPDEEQKFADLKTVSDAAPLSNPTLDKIIEERTKYAVIPPYGLFAQGVAKLREVRPQLALAGLKGKKCSVAPVKDEDAMACIDAAAARTKSAAAVTDGMVFFEEAHKQLSLYDGLRAKKTPDGLHSDLADGFRNLRRIANKSLSPDEWYQAVTQTLLDLAAAFENTEKALGKSREDAAKLRDALRELAAQLNS